MLLWICLFLLLPASAQEGWKKVRDKEGIQVFTLSTSKRDFKDFRGITRVKAGMNDFLAVLYDVEALRIWGYNIRSAELLERPSDKVQVYYAVAAAPFPYRDRDGVYRNRFEWDAGSRTLLVQIDLLQDRLPEKEDRVRISGSGYWKVVEMPGGELDVTFEMRMDPGGNVPAWLANLFAGDTPYHTLLGLRSILSEDKYRGKTHHIIN